VTKPVDRSGAVGDPSAPPSGSELTRWQAIRLVVEELEGERPNDPASAFIGEDVIARKDVLQAIDLFTTLASAADRRVPREPLFTVEEIDAVLSNNPCAAYRSMREKLLAMREFSNPESQG
jgi:hypothetical protein